MIRAGNLSRLERILAGSVGAILLVASVCAMVLSIARGQFLLLLPALGAVWVAYMFIAAARKGQPL